MPPVQHLRVPRQKRPHTHPEPDCVLGTAAVVNISAGLDCEAVSRMGSVEMPGSSRGFGGAASFSVYQLWVQEGAAQAALNKACPRPVAKSFLHVGDVVVRRQDTSRKRVQVVEPHVRDVRVTRVLDPRHLLPRRPRRGACSSGALVESYRTTMKAALGAAVY